MFTNCVYHIAINENKSRYVFNQKLLITYFKPETEASLLFQTKLSFK